MSDERPVNIGESPPHEIVLSRGGYVQGNAMQALMGRIALDGENQRGEEPKNTRPSLSRRRGWFKIHRADMHLIRERGIGNSRKVSVPTLIALWCAVVEMSDEERSETFTHSIGLIAYRAGVSKRTAEAALPVLESLSLISHTENRKPGSKEKLPNTWTIHPAILTPTAKSAVGYGKDCAAPTARDEREKLRGCSVALDVLGEGVDEIDEGRRGAPTSRHGAKGLTVSQKSETHGERFKLPKFSDIPSPLYESTANAMLAAVDAEIKAIKKEAKKTPIMMRTKEGTVFQNGETLETEAAKAIALWKQRRQEINRALAG